MSGRIGRFRINSDWNFFEISMNHSYMKVTDNGSSARYTLREKSEPKSEKRWKINTIESEHMLRGGKSGERNRQSAASCKQ